MEQTMTLDEVKGALRRGEVLSLEVHALDASLYVLFRRLKEGRVPVTRGGESLRYRSRYAALQDLADLGLDRVDCVHLSAYGEMIGCEGSSAHTELRESVPIAHLRRRSASG